MVQNLALEDAMFKTIQLSKEMEQFEVTLALSCPAYYLNTLLQADELVVTNSNKLRVYSKARFYLDDDLMEIVLTGKLPSN